MDIAVKLFFASALLLVLLNATAALLFSVLGSAFAGLVGVALLLTAAFAIAGVSFAVVRSLKRARV